MSCRAINHELNIIEKYMHHLTKQIEPNKKHLSYQFLTNDYDPLIKTSFHSYN